LIERREILDMATRMSLTPQIVEKDYALGWMLAGISAHEALFNSRLINVVHAGDRAANLPGGVPRKMAEEALVTGSIIKMADEPDNGFVADLLIENTSAFAFYQ